MWMKASQRNGKLWQQIFRRIYPWERLERSNFNAEFSARKYRHCKKKIDDFLKDLLKEKKKTNKQNIRNIFEKLQNKTRDVMDPLANLWKILEDAKQAENEAVQISVNELFFYVEQIVIL